MGLAPILYAQEIPQAVIPPLQMATEVITAAKNAEFWRLGSSTALANLCETRLDTP